MTIRWARCFFLFVILASLNTPETKAFYTDDDFDREGFPLLSPTSITPDRHTAIVYNMLGKMRKTIFKPFVNTKRGMDFGLSRGFSASQAAKHFMGISAAKYSGGPGKRKRAQSLPRH